jgi:hypothetical protein
MKLLSFMVSFRFSIKTPNQSVKPTRSGLRPPRAAYLQRYAAPNSPISHRSVYRGIDFGGRHVARPYCVLRLVHLVPLALRTQPAVALGVVAQRCGISHRRALAFVGSFKV